ncbi:amidohydrolase [Lewinella sp. LCG006]|uniref:amidohydrolase n=1 Tax=Lewinella sp. LCG006 TaxID=3231911 RepID=UPI00346148C5
MSTPALIALRKDLHQHPELSGSEVATAQRISTFVATHGKPTEIITGIGGTGLAVVYAYANTGPTIVIRCELDALPIMEENTFAHRSLNDGVSHKCGHDGHMAIVAGLIFWLQEQTFKTGKVVLLFQPAEETGQGACRVVEDPRFKALNVDYVFALHNIPGEPLHRIITMKSGFSAEVQSFAIYLTGKEAHAAEPENGNNPALALAEIIKALAQLNVNEPAAENFAVLTPVYINLGQKSYGISPAQGELHYTIRTWSTAQMELLKARLEEIFTQVTATHQLAFDVSWFEHFPASSNEQECNDLVIAAAEENGFEIMRRAYPFKFGEDFGWFSKNYKTAMFGVGAGTTSPALHHANYDFPDELIPTGIAMFAGIISKIL